MDRSRYRIFSPGCIAGLEFPNRLVRSATWDPCILSTRQMTAEVLDVYRSLALGGVGLIISGGLPVFRERFPDEAAASPYLGYSRLRVNGLEDMPYAVHQANPACKIAAQLEVGPLTAAPSTVPTPFAAEPPPELTVDQIEQVVESFVEAVCDVQASGFDAVQLHAAHGGLLSRFLSPYTNRRTDAYGGPPENRARVVTEIVRRARRRVGSFPILVKVNGTDYLEGGAGLENFPALAQALVQSGVDAIEVSGGMWECLLRSEAELGFRPVPSPESHTRLGRPERQSYFLRYAEALDVGVPVILVGGNRDVERLEAILQGGKVDFIALSRPLIREPGLPNRWRRGAGSRHAACISCNACLYAMYVHPGLPEPGLVRCVLLADREMYRAAQRWLPRWLESS